MIRPRRTEDLPELARVLLEQQPGSRYPFRDPLPVPVEQFLHADDAVAAWTAEVDGRAAGHVCRVDTPRGTDTTASTLAARAHGCDATDLAWVSALFVGTGARGIGLGRDLLATVVADIAGAGRRACLEVLPVHPAALELYRATGWTGAGRLRPGWLAADAPDLLVLVRR